MDAHRSRSVRPREERKRGVEFHAITGFNESSIFAVGQYGEIWHFDGRTWTQEDSPTSVALTRATVASKGRVFVAGMAGTVLRGRRGQWAVAAEGTTSEDFWGLVEYVPDIYLSNYSGVFRLIDDDLEKVESVRPANPDHSIPDAHDEHHLVGWAQRHGDVLGWRNVDCHSQPGGGKVIAQQAPDRPIVEAVLAQHVEDVAILWNTRSTFVDTGHVTLVQLVRFHRRIAAHVDGCVVAGRPGLEKMREWLADASASTLFAAFLCAVEGEDRSFIGSCIATAEALPEAVWGVVSALGWADRSRLVGIGRDVARRGNLRSGTGSGLPRVESKESTRASCWNRRCATVTNEWQRRPRTLGVVGRREFMNICPTRSSSDEHLEFWSAGRRSSLVIAAAD